jgi:uroporphyrinogen III methyltransferase/synthase
LVTRGIRNPQMSDPSTPLVYLVGAGSGDPGLLTLRGHECLARADVVIHDKLVHPRILDFAPTAIAISVEDLPGQHPQRWPHIHQSMIDFAREGKIVVRLKGGDPIVFGRGAEEAESLREAGIPYEIVPGITAAVAAAAYAEIPLTHRTCASAVAFITGHENPTKPESSLDWAALAKFPGTLAIYMGMARLELIVQVLLANGKPPDTPAAIVQTASLGTQITRITVLSKLDQTMRDEGMMAPAIILIGPVVDLRPAHSWFELRPLFGVRVLVTRPKHQAADLVRRLEQLGAVPLVLPAVEVRDPPDWRPVDHAISRLKEYDWLVFTSVNGVSYFFRRLFATGRDLRAVGHLKFAAIGPSTADALARLHLTADVVPPAFRSEDLAAALKSVAGGKRILLARADRGRDVLRQELSSIAHVDQIAVYSQVDAVAPDAPALLALSRGEIAFVTFTSANIAKAVLSQLDETARMRVRDGSVKLVSISPVTSAAIREMGYEIAAEATEYTTEGVIRAMTELVRSAF